MKLNFQPKSYKARVKGRFVKEIQAIKNKYDLINQNIVLVTDINTAFKLSNIFIISELISLGITFIQRLEVKRKRLNHHAIYFIEPTRTNLDLLRQDFENPDQPQYRKIHILFTTFVPQSFLKDLASNKLLLKRIAKNSIKQFYHSCILVSSNTISANIPYLSLCYSDDTQTEEDTRNILANKFVQIIANMDRVNKVKIYFKKGANKVCERMAMALQETIKNYLGILIKNKSYIIDKNAQDIVLLMVDRSVDTVTPLVHHFSYQCLLLDLIKIKFTGIKDIEDKGHYSYEEIQNQVYQKYRYQHISMALSKLPEQLNSVKQQLQNIKDKADLSSLNIKSLNTKVSELKANIDLLNVVWNKFKTENIQQISQLQQSLSTGLTSEGLNTSSTKLVSLVASFIKSQNYEKQIKIRLALLCLCCIKFSKNDYEELLSLFLPEQKLTFKNIIALGVSYDSTVKKSTKTITKQQQAIAKKRMEKTGMPLNRYTTIVQLILPLFCNILLEGDGKKKIDPQVFGNICFSALPTEDQQQKISNFSHQKIVFGMIGGLTWNEISSLRSLPQLSDVIIFTDQIINSKEFIKQLSLIKHSQISL